MAVAQLAPAGLLGLFWQGSTREGALAGLFGGILVWAYTLLLPALALVELCLARARHLVLVEREHVMQEQVREAPVSVRRQVHAVADGEPVVLPARIGAGATHRALPIPKATAVF